MFGFPNPTAFTPDYLILPMFLRSVKRFTREPYHVPAIIDVQWASQGRRENSRGQGQIFSGGPMPSLFIR
jgi:hypothetical protein